MWIEPKTDYTNNDFFNAEDYNRIVGNISHLRLLSLRLVKKYDLNIDFENKDYTKVPYASEFKALNTAIDIINKNTYNLALGKAVEVGKKLPTANFYNRVEQATLDLYNAMMAQYDALEKYPITLGLRGLF